MQGYDSRHDTRAARGGPGLVTEVTPFSRLAEAPGGAQVGNLAVKHEQIRVNVENSTPIWPDLARIGANPPYSD